MKKKTQKFILILMAILTITTNFNWGILNVFASEKGDIDTEVEEILSDENIDLVNLEYTDEEIIMEASLDTDEQETIETELLIDYDNSETSVTVIEVTEEGIEEKITYSLNIEELDEENQIATFTNEETGEEFYYDSNLGYTSFAISVPLGIAITTTLLAALAKTGATIVLAGVTYVVFSKAASKVNRKKYNHFRAHRKDGKLYLGSAFKNDTAAINWARSGKDTWSISSNQAKKVAKGANLSGSPYREIDRKNGKPRPGRFWHWHPYKKKPNMHAFYGNPA